ncbi:phospholipase D-like domain-containing protein [Thioalkalivibrio sp. ALE30]|uniref:phospholipase D-like domain-containing protein n=1 Tax=Thioalkalivibrio sp. ALE30 TaxID=1158181 RepID=UPI00035FC773|nr:phospholipase D-like domain-containing protein [Thioalkalivibrio sp. ALE30]
MLDTGWIASIAAVAVFALAAISVVHALLQRRDTGTIIAWVGLIVLLPLGGSVLYWLFGVNRIRRRAHALREGYLIADPSAGGATLSEPPERWQRLLHSGDRLSPFRLVGGNAIEPLFDGDRTYARMLDAIDSARHSITLATYIFDYDRVGERFVDRLQQAQDRGVQVRVLIDAIGARYSRRNTLRRLRRAGIPATTFMPVHLPRSLAAFNLRNHRKMLVVDGRQAFTGGMNIRRGHSHADPGPHPIHDLHFELRGPACTQLQRVFTEDWQFATGERLDGPRWFPDTVDPAGARACRGLPDGPDEDFEVLNFTLQSALAEAREQVTIITPYFLPDVALTGALKAAALRGVRVDILIPARSNLRLVEWASRPQQGELLERGCRLWLTPPPFNHAKLMLVDREWALVGSANWDPRSLRLNFEFNLECLDAGLGGELATWADGLRAQSHPLTLDEVRARPLPAQLRDGAARLLTPYL